MPYTAIQVNLKGGVGKTEQAKNCGLALAQAGKRVLAIDGDSDRCLTDSLVEEEPTCTLFDLLREPGQGIERAVVPYERIPLEGCFHLIPGSEEISTAPAAFSDAQIRQPVASFNEVLPYLIKNFASAYDLIIIDPGPNRDAVNDALLMSAQGAFVPSAAEPLAFKGLTRILNRIRRNNKDRARLGLPGETTPLGIVLSKVMPDQHEVADQMAAAFSAAKTHCLTTRIPYSRQVWESTGALLPVWAYAPNDPAAVAYLQLTAEMEALMTQAQGTH